MKLCWVTITVKSMEDSLKFYQDIVGLKVNRRFEAGPGVEIVFLGDEEGGTQIELIHNEHIKNINVGKDISLGFLVDSIENHMKFVQENGVEIHDGPFQPNPSTRFFYVLDPNNIRIQFVEQK